MKTYIKNLADHTGQWDIQTGPLRPAFYWYKAVHFDMYRCLGVPLKVNQLERKI